MWDFSIFAGAEAWGALLTLTAMEIVLGIDNIVFISILANRLPEHERARARTIGLALALFSRLGLLFAISWLMGLKTPLFEVLGHAFSGRDLILGAGGLFLLAKATSELFESVELPRDEGVAGAGRSLVGVVAQIALLDMVFSLDSVITAVGMADHLLIMVIAVVVAVLVMLIFAKAIGAFIDKHPSMKVLALAFLLMVGVMLVADALGQHFNKGYVYFAMAFSLGVEMINLRARGKRAIAADDA